MHDMLCALCVSAVILFTAETQRAQRLMVFNYLYRCVWLRIDADFSPQVCL